mmetsp:Transcript_1322/g.3244  ORF Transcript_1322/g.3244 Transcript_1322/m.3244 type:complete len:119 (-) Transcript_1322:33-389(-)
MLAEKVVPGLGHLDIELGFVRGVFGVTVGDDAKEAFSVYPRSFLGRSAFTSKVQGSLELAVLWTLLSPPLLHRGLGPSPSDKKYASMSAKPPLLALLRRLTDCIPYQALLHAQATTTD